MQNRKMPKKTIFSEQWLDHDEFKIWLCRVEGNVYKARCRLCKKDFELSNMGKQSLVSHQNGAIHKSNSKAGTLPKINTFFHASSPPTNSFASSSIQDTIQHSSSNIQESPPFVIPSENRQNNLTNYSFCKSDSITAEIRWCLYVVSTRSSLNTSIEVSDLFRQMFPDSKIAGNFKLGKTKCAYVINHGIAPYFHNRLLDTIRKSEEYVICFDEALNKVSQKGQMDLVVRYFDEAKGMVCNRYLDSEFMGFAKSEDILKHFTNGIRFLNKNKLLQVSMDGPNVNLSFLKKLKQERKETDPDAIQLLDIGVCGLHVVHGAMKTGLASVSWDLHVFLRHVYYVFKDTPARRSLFTSKTGCSKFPLKYCGVRWLENKKCLDRCLNIFEELKLFFEQNDLPKTQPIENLKQFFKDEFLESKLSFFYVITSEFEPFLTKFQAEKPLAFYLYEDLLILIKNLLSRIVKKKVMSDCTKGSQLLALDLSNEANLLEIKNVDIGFKATKLIKKQKGSEKEILKFKLECRKLIIALISKIEERSPLRYDLVVNLSSLNPRNVLKTNNLYTKRFQNLLQNLYDCNRIDDECAERAKKQYLNACTEATTILKEKYEYFVLNESTQRADQFYFNNLSNNENSKDLWKIIKMMLILSHGNASVESGFSINKTLLVENLLEESLVAQRRVLDGIKEAGKVSNVEVTPNLISNVKSSHSRYIRHLEEKKKKQESEENALEFKRKREQDIKKLQDQKKKLKIEAQAEEEKINHQLSLLKK